MGSPPFPANLATKIFPPKSPPLASYKLQVPSHSGLTPFRLGPPFTLLQKTWLNPLGLCIPPSGDLTSGAQTWKGVVQFEP